MNSPVHAPAVGVRLHTFGTAPEAGLKLYCFAHAGGAASAYRTWPVLLPEGVGLRAVQLPGRAELSALPPLTDLRDIAAAVADTVAEDAGDSRFAFFGHSMGALAAFETARELRRRGLPLPVVLGVSGSRAPHQPNVGPDLHGLPDDALIARLTDLGGIAPEIAAHAELLDMVLPAIRADLRALAEYRHLPESPLPMPFAVFGGDADPWVGAAELDAWRGHSREAVSTEVFPGSHFFTVRWASRIVATLGDLAAR